VKLRIFLPALLGISLFSISLVAATLDGMLIHSNVNDGICTLPVLGLYADKSRSGNSEYMKTHFPKMDYKEIPGTGHFLMLEKPEAFNRLVLEFLDTQKY